MQSHIWDKNIDICTDCYKNNYTNYSKCNCDHAVMNSQARTQPKIYAGGGKLVFQDLYVFNFAALKKF